MSELHTESAPMLNPLQLHVAHPSFPSTLDLLVHLVKELLLHFPLPIRM